MPKKFKIFKISIGLKGVEHVAEKFQVSKPTVYEALKGGTSQLSRDIWNYVDENKTFFKQNYRYEKQTVYLY